MNNDALVAALGMDAVAAVHGYRQRVVAEARQRGLRLVGEALSGVLRTATRVRVIDPIEIRLTFRHCPGREWLAGRSLRWNPAHGWSVSHWRAEAPLAHYAGLDATPLQLVPVPAEVVRWAAGEPTGRILPPTGVELDDDPRAIARLLAFADPRPGWPGSAAYQADTTDRWARRTG